MSVLDTKFTAIADAIRAKNNTTAKLSLAAMATAVEGIECGTEFSLTVTTEAGASVTVSKGGTSYTQTAANGTAVFTLSEAGDWTVNAIFDGEASDPLVVSVADTFATELSFIDIVLNNNTWAKIAQTAKKGQAANIWSVGDCKAATLNGTVGALTFSNETYYAFIIGINHNADLEGANLIHFQFGKTAAAGGVDICFADSYLNGSGGGFRMNTSATNTGGWANSYMRGTICAAFVSVLPSDLQSVLATVTKYTNNTGKSTAASAITATTDTVFMPSEYEERGSASYSNASEANYQAQYAYYAAGNSKVKYKHSATGTAATLWLRSPHKSSATSFACVDTAGGFYYVAAGNSYGFAPCFCVGGEAA